MFAARGDQTWFDKVPPPLWPLAEPGADPMVLVWRPAETPIDDTWRIEEVAKSILAMVSR